MVINKGKSFIKTNTLNSEKSSCKIMKRYRHLDEEGPYMEDEKPGMSSFMKIVLAAGLFVAAGSIMMDSKKNRNVIYEKPGKQYEEKFTVNNDIKDPVPVVERIEPIGKKTLEEKVYEPSTDFYKTYGDCFKRSYDSDEEIPDYNSFSKEIINGAGASNAKRMLQIVDEMESWEELPLYKNRGDERKAKLDFYLKFFKEDPLFNRLAGYLKTEYDFDFEGKTWEEFLAHYNFIDSKVERGIEDIVTSSSNTIPLDDKNKDDEDAPLPLVVDKNGEGYTAIQIWNKYKEGPGFLGNMLKQARRDGSSLKESALFVEETLGTKGLENYFASNKFDKPTNDEIKVLEEEGINVDSLQGNVALLDYRIGNLDRIVNGGEVEDDPLLEIELQERLSELKSKYSLLLGSRDSEGWVGFDKAKKGMINAIKKKNKYLGIGLMYRDLNEDCSGAENYKSILNEQK